MKKSIFEFINDNMKLWGITPTDFYNKYYSSCFPRIFANSLPKSGTHLLERLLYLTPGVSRQLGKTILYNEITKLRKKILELKKSQFLVAHIPWTSELENFLFENKIKTLFMYRDPRDIVVSKYKYITYKNTDHRLHRFYLNKKSDYERLRIAIIGDVNIGASSIKDDLIKYQAWIDANNCLSVKYEDLIGENGGGSVEIQTKTIKSIYDYLEINISDISFAGISTKVFYTRSKTFNKSLIGQWKYEFNDELKNLFKQSSGDLLIKYGYEKDLLW
ncbi:MAG: sulfotransferase domain-containing protein [Melioribacteraceae bacterium]|nr:sulfotransferase domain-containing protein [Saprospiraceae bacterium]MCF8356404.1 sulfotransferase domain-containing protein [Melioribacteraceae bacterium]MCF8394763.1 sulfotransferase domain-containing protein [Melioribacteraceae bacterium]